MRQRLVRIESRNAGVVVTVSERAFSVRAPMLMSLAQDGISPQRIVVKCRDFLAFSLRTVRTGCVGAMLYRGRSSISSSAAPKRSARYCFECVSRYRLHTNSLSQVGRACCSERIQSLIFESRPLAIQVQVPVENKGRTKSKLVGKESSHVIPKK